MKSGRKDPDLLSCCLGGNKKFESISMEKSSLQKRERKMSVNSVTVDESRTLVDNSTSQWAFVISESFSHRVQLNHVVSFPSPRGRIHSLNLFPISLPRTDVIRSNFWILILVEYISHRIFKFYRKGACETFKVLYLFESNWQIRKYLEQAKLTCPCLLLQDFLTTLTSNNCWS